MDCRESACSQWLVGMTPLTPPSARWQYTVLQCSLALSCLQFVTATSTSPPGRVPCTSSRRMSFRLPRSSLLFSSEQSLYELQCRITQSLNPSVRAPHTAPPCGWQRRLLYISCAARPAKRSVMCQMWINVMDSLRSIYCQPASELVPTWILIVGDQQRILLVGPVRTSEYTSNGILSSAFDIVKRTLVYITILNVRVNIHKYTYQPSRTIIGTTIKQLTKLRSTFIELQYIVGPHIIIILLI